MKRPGTFKDIELGPLDGLFDARTKSGSLPPGAFRLVLNMDRSEAHNHCRLGGWKKLMADSPFGFKNQDFHDQMLDCAFYAEEYSETIHVAGELAGYVYPYFVPAATGATAQTQGDWLPPDYFPNLGCTDQVNGYTWRPSASLSVRFPSSGNQASDPNLIFNAALLSWWFDQVENAFLTSGTVWTSYRLYWSWQASSDSWNAQTLQQTGVYVHYINAGWELHVAYCPSASGSSGGSLAYSGGYGYGPLTYVYGVAYDYDYDYCHAYQYLRDSCREHVSLIYEFVTAAGRRRLVIGTRSRLAMLNERGGNWRVILDGLGGAYSEAANCNCSDRRFRVAQIGNVLMITNDFDPVLFWPFESGPFGCNFWSADYVPELVELGIVKARVVSAWNGYVFIANVEQQNERRANRIFWSDFNNPLTWVPAANSDAGSQDLGLGERIIRIEPIGGRLLIYTRKNPVEYAIYETRLVGGDAVFVFNEIYRGPDGVEFDNSLVNLGNAHYWLSQSGIMELTEYDRAPHRIEWMHRADGAIYKGVESDWVKSFSGLSGFGPVNRSACDQVIGYYDSERRCLWFSWPTDNNDCPNMSLRLNLTYQHASLVDHGFTAGGMHKADYVQSLRDWMVEQAGCYPLTLLLDKEGVPYSYTDPTSTPAYVRNYQEDPALAVNPNSVCARVAGTDLDDLCQACDTDPILILASATDKALKEFVPDGYYRERYLPESTAYDCPQTSPGKYTLDGYYSMLQSDAGDLGQREEKMINRACVDYVAEEQTVPNNLYFEIAYGQQPRCLTWDTSAAAKQLKCLTDRSAAQHAANNTRPSLLATYNFFRRGVYLAWRMYINGTGGGACFNQITLSARLAQGQWK